MIRTGTTTAGLLRSATTGAIPGTTAGVEITTIGTSLIAAAPGDLDYHIAGARAGMAGIIIHIIPARWS